MGKEISIFDHDKAKIPARELEKTIIKRPNVKGREKEVLGRSFGLNSRMPEDSDDEKFDNGRIGKRVPSAGSYFSKPPKLYEIKNN